MSNYKSNRKKKFLAQKGQVAVIIAILIVCLMGMAALVIDVGSLYQKRAFLQTVADSAALAGAQELPGNPENQDDAKQAAIDYARKNNVVIDSVTDVEISKTLSPYLSPYYDIIKVTFSDPAPVYFAGVLGINTVDVGASATAMVGEPKQPYYAVSWAAAPWAAIVPTTTTNWWDYLITTVPGEDKWITTYSASNYKTSTSSFCAWSEKSPPLNWYTDRIKYGYSSPLSVGGTIYVQAIDMTVTVPPTNTRVGVWDPFSDLVTIEYNIEGKEVLKLAKSSDTQLVIVPVIGVRKKPGLISSTASILAFAPFILEGIRVVGTDTQIYGRFIHQALIVYDGEVVGVKPAGLRVIRLIR